MVRTVKRKRDSNVMRVLTHCPALTPDNNMSSWHASLEIVIINFVVVVVVAPAAARIVLDVIVVFRCCCCFFVVVTVVFAAVFIINIILTNGEYTPGGTLLQSFAVSNKSVPPTKHPRCHLSHSNPPKAESINLSKP